LRRNLAHLLKEIVGTSQQRDNPTLAQARHWHTLAMQDLNVPDPRFVGAFRGESGLENVQVQVGENYGVDSANVAEQLRAFEAKLQTLVTELDALLPINQEPDADQLAAIIDLCAWTHAEWVRIHPFANGNGRTARLWANSLAMRYGLPPFIRLRPRSNPGYTTAGAQAMQGNWKPTATVFRRLLEDLLNSQ
jgi:fido (protein-threonine AMPylation protein)